MTKARTIMLDIRDHTKYHNGPAAQILWIPYIFTNLNEVIIEMSNEFPNLFFNIFGRPTADALKFFSDLKPSRNFYLTMGVRPRKKYYDRTDYRLSHDLLNNSVGHHVVHACEHVVQELMKRADDATNLLRSDVVTAASLKAHESMVVRRMQDFLAGQGAMGARKVLSRRKVYWAENGMNLFETRDSDVELSEVDD